MARPTTKTDLLESATQSYLDLQQYFSALTENERMTAFDFSQDSKKKEAHWARDKNVRDVLAHLHEWHCLVIDWVEGNLEGNDKKFFPEPYNWRTYGQYNQEIFERYQTVPLEQVQEKFAQSHEEILSLIGRFSNDELFSKGTYPWVGGSSLGSYFVSATSSHYEWAMKKLRAHQRRLKNKEK
ncbi:MAG: ClbS/DfsB family four-helix bundle protein [Lactococcus sp.]